MQKRDHSPSLTCSRPVVSWPVVTAYATQRTRLLFSCWFCIARASEWLQSGHVWLWVPVGEGAGWQAGGERGVLKRTAGIQRAFLVVSRSSGRLFVLFLRKGPNNDTSGPCLSLFLHRQHYSEDVLLRSDKTYRLTRLPILDVLPQRGPNLRRRHFHSESGNFRSGQPIGCPFCVCQ